MYKVMLVDDEDTILRGLSSLLPWEKYGCTVTAACVSGADALDTIRRDCPHILFTDIRMPGMDGLGLIAALRSEYPDIQIAILSGYPEFRYAQEAMRLGVSHYILKPSKMAELEEALAAMVSRLTPESHHGEEESARHEGAAQAGNFITDNAIRYIREHYAEKLTLPDVAEKVCVSQWHLSKLIAKHTGKSFSDLLNGVRIAQAKKLLLDPTLKIWEISEQVGFADVTHFSRIFKKLENQSANEFRNHLSPSALDE